MTISSDGLATLVAVVREGTFEAAARSLHITPSAVSQRIKALESTVGRVVVQRGKPARATADGQVLLRLAKQWDLLISSAFAELTGEDDSAHDDPRDRHRIHLPIAVNADSLAIWLLPVVARMQQRHPVAMEVLRGDESANTEFLRAGEVVGAITSHPTPIRGCTVRRLGATRYLPVANHEFAEYWFPDGLTGVDLARAPLVSFDRNDQLQAEFIRRHTRKRVSPPTTYIPASTEYHRAIELGAGWGTVPEVQIADALDAGTVVTLSDRHIDVELFWQFWSVHSPLIDELTEMIAAAAADSLV
ncbi:LysR family transcriptional regulator ArgP [Williamsia sp. CHRR-6]|uniref:LysR family transcriptional regulator ArgP n=1 Tax=Williamsia sp. CHRR-6 TaxID=2835871 RepID=UPI001BD96D53|nr:LysR family transcriptional regulator ArgP [Williamsia sp. CHRR-6]MBT0567348.1 LysR family transcriptional regulator ArgP [Williamsia sp. CHRR-6]